MSKVYLVIWEDRHTDVRIRAWSEMRAAVDDAKRIAADYPDAEEKSLPGWIYYARLTCEAGDAVRVQMAEVD